MNKPLYEFHIRKESRQKYEIDDSLFSLRGTLIHIDLKGARQLALQMNKLRPPESPVISAGHLIALGLLDEIFHFAIQYYREQVNPGVFGRIEIHLNETISKSGLNQLFFDFLKHFPTTSIYRGATTTVRYLEQDTAGYSHRHITLEEILVLWLDNSNPANHPLSELIDHTDLQRGGYYPRVLSLMESFFRQEPALSGKKESLIDFLMAPIKAHPFDILAQIQAIRREWTFLPASILEKILFSMDILQEENKVRFDPALFGPPPAMITEFGAGEYAEAEQFSPDLHWMPRVVMMAKSTYVWLDQLSRQYQRPIHRLDEIPDEELLRLSSFGFTALWLIGLWERSTISQKIKRMRGNPEAVSSAYSLADYIIAEDLGGEEAYLNLKHRAWHYGIRLASDMVPNHMGIDSRWVKEHPHWFVQNDYPPFPGYGFNSENLSDDPNFGIYIEDGYWTESDAAVVFKFTDQRNGETRFIYHGNDGTSMPWNDTAQLNYLLPEVREAVIQTILHVARKFPVIRFDAAMTLAKKHYQRLWFPLPGHGGDIPSRAEHALTQENFDQAFPVEFWREVVDRVAKEVPDTLLLAEAFWMMEGYFVRTLGMHRVYNSAFMNMLKNEENYKYRQSIKNVLDFNPQILKRYVNFMNNPDEDTAINQFGKDDKYFGVCLLMSTMPGLPMFGHGQIEGFAEKYGMEYKCAYWAEHPDQWLIDRHQKEIFPLLRKRYLFSEVENFLLYDVYNSFGQVMEDVYAYSNRYGSEAALVLYNNKFNYASGWIRNAAPYRIGDQLIFMDLARGLGIDDDFSGFVIFREAISGQEFIRQAWHIREKGMFVDLPAFKYQVFMDFRKTGLSREWAEFEQYLGGRGVADINTAFLRFRYKPILDAAYEAVNPGSVSWLWSEPVDSKIREEVQATFLEKKKSWIDALEQFNALRPVQATGMEERFSHWRKFSHQLINDKTGKISKDHAENISKWLDCRQSSALCTEMLVSFLFISALDFRQVELPVPILLREAWRDYADYNEALPLFQTLISLPESLFTIDDYLSTESLLNIFNIGEVRSYLQMHRWQNEVYVHKESYDNLLKALTVFNLLNEGADGSSGKIRYKRIAEILTRYKMLIEEAGQVSYNINRLFADLQLDGKNTNAPK